MHLSGDRLVAARLNGRIDFLRLETYNQGRQIDWGFMSAYRRSNLIFFSFFPINKYLNIFFLLMNQLIFEPVQREAYLIHS